MSTCVYVISILYFHKQFQQGESTEVRTLFMHCYILPQFLGAWVLTRRGVFPIKGERHMSENNLDCDTKDSGSKIYTRHETEGISLHPVLYNVFLLPKYT